ncbi:hypothetical protein [Streptomyces sp. NPDC050759]|uniref:hypothetical protein n=1 Tax=Streptomyces sp. NPDC050759 TaxID=3365635 RepID=UPI0037A30C23
MRIPWRRRPAGRSRRLLDAAGIGPASTDDGNDQVVGREVAYRVAQRDSGAITEVLAIVEELLEDEANYEFVVSLLENIQNLVSHGLDMFWSPDEVYALLGARSAVCWNTLTGFWTAVADWCARTGLSLEPAEPLLTIQNEQLKVLLWTGNRTLSTGEKLGLAQAVRYEKANGASIPNYSHIAVALRSTGQQ